MHLILAPTFRAESRSSWEIRVCLEPEIKSPPYSLVHSHTFFVSLLCSWMHERLTCFWEHSQKSIDSLNFSFFFLFFFLSVLFDFLIIYCPWSKPPKLDSCTPIILPSCKVTAQQSTLCFPFSVDQIYDVYCRLTIRSRWGASWAGYPRPMAIPVNSENRN